MNPFLKKSKSLLPFFGLITAVLLLFPFGCEQNGNNPTFADQIGKVGAVTPQKITVSTDKMHVQALQGKAWMAIPQNAFRKANGEPVSGQINLEVREALQPLSIVKAGLQTVSNGQLLETNGMYALNASQNGEALVLDPKVGVLISPDLPQGDTSYHFFRAETKENGMVNWVRLAPENETRTATLRSAKRKKQCRKCQKMIGNLKIIQAKNKKNIRQDTDTVEFWERRFVLKEDGLWFYQSGEKQRIFTTEEIKACKELLEQDKSLAHMLTAIKELGEPNVRDRAIYKIDSLGAWYNIDKVSNRPVCTIKGTIEKSNRNTHIHVLSTEVNVHIRQFIPPNGEQFTCKFTQDVLVQVLMFQGKHWGVWKGKVTGNEFNLPEIPLNAGKPEELEAYLKQIEDEKNKSAPKPSV